VDRDVKPQELTNTLLVDSDQGGHTSLLEKLHWLPISERIKHKVACMCFSAINGSGPAYLSELLHVYSPSRTVPVAQAWSINIPQISNMIPVEVQKKFTIHGKCIQ